MSEQLTANNTHSDFDRQLQTQIRISNDFYFRSRTGPIFYIIAILVSALSDNMYSLYSTQVVTVVVLFSLIAVIRLKIAKPEPTAAAIKRWSTINWLLLSLTAAIWGGFFSWVIATTALPNVIQTLLIATTAFSIITSTSFCFNRTMSQFICVLFIGPEIVSLVYFQPELFALTLGVTVLLVFLLIAVIRNHQEYHQYVNNEVSLIETQEKLRVLSHTDALTGLANRRAYNAFFTQAYNFSHRHHSQLSLVVFDLDGFKGINDQYGHAAGDLCLQHIAGIILAHCKRNSDLAARIGGEEFAIVLPETNAKTALSITEAIHQSFNERSLVIEGQSITITASFGIASYDKLLDKNVDDIFFRADQASYQAKAFGKNTIAVAKQTTAQSADYINNPRA